MYAPTGENPWLQILTLDRRTLDMVRNVTIQSEVGGAIRKTQIELATDEVQRGNEAQLVVLSGGGRAANVELGSSGLNALLFLFDLAGAIVNVDDAYETELAEQINRGTWSSIGIPGVLESGQINLGGLEYGLRADDSASPGSLAGYLRRGGLGNFSFVSAAYAAIDTRATGSTDTVNVVRVGATDYTSETLVPGTSGVSGFHVVVLDGRLRLLDNKTFATNGLGTNHDFHPETTAMQEYLAGLHAGNLVVVQSINTPFGWQREWVNDGPLVSNTFAHEYNKVVERAPSLWYDPDSTGESLSGALGLLGGAKAHDQFAELNSDPGHRTNGFTMVASVGQLGVDDSTTNIEPLPVAPGSDPVVHVGSTLSNPSQQVERKDRVVGMLRRDRRSLWSIASHAPFDRPSSPSLDEITYQAPTEWPLSSGVDNQRANCYFATQLFAGLGYTDVRTAYYNSDLTPDQWLSKVNSIRNLEWNDALQCSGRTFSQSVFHAMQAQLADEMNMVASVAGVFTDWAALFGDATFENYIDLQTIANKIISDIESIDASDQSMMSTGDIISSVLTIVAAGSSVVEPELGAALFAMSGVFELMAQTSSSTGQPSLGPLESEISSLAKDLITQLEGATANLSQIQNILVSDWGKLQQSSSLAAGWTPQAPEIHEILTISAKRQFYSALLPTVYGLYYINPGYVDGSLYPWGITCANNEPFHDVSTPLGTSDPDNGALTQPIVATTDNEVFYTWLWLGTPVEIKAGGEVTGGDSHQPDLRNVGGDDLFKSLASDDPSALGMNKTAFFADPRFTARWFWCSRPQ